MQTEDDLIEANRGLVKSLVQEFNPRNSNEFDELEQAGLIGLMKAIRKHDPIRGRLTTYAYYYILGEIKEFIRQEKYEHIKQDRLTEPITRPYTTITEYVDNLSPKEQIIVDMRLAGHTFTEIAEKLGCSATSVHSLYKTMIDRIILANE